MVNLGEKISMGCVCISRQNETWYQCQVTELFQRMCPLMSLKPIYIWKLSNLLEKDKQTNHCYRALGAPMVLDGLKG